MKHIVRILAALTAMALPVAAQVGPGPVPQAQSSVLRVYLAANEAITDSTQTVIKYDTVTKDTQGAYSTSTGLATFKRAGNYQVCVSAAAQAVTATTALYVYLLKNSTIVSRVEVGPYTAGAAQSAPGSFCDIVNVNGSGDTVNASVFHVATGGSNAVIGSVTPFTVMSATYLGS